MQICSDYGLYQESIDINSANHDPRSPCGERHANRIEIGEWVKFQPTPPSREATDKAITEYFSYKIFQSTPPSREATSWTRSSSVRTSDFNPHLPRARRHRFPSNIAPSAPFQPTPPSREATWPPPAQSVPSLYFNPHLPRGRRRFLLTACAY